MPQIVICVHEHPQRETWPQQQQFFEGRILPDVTALPGFQSGSWAYDAQTSRTHSYVQFDSDAHAQKLIDMVRHGASVPNAFGVTLISATIATETFRR